MKPTRPVAAYAAFLHEVKNRIHSARLNAGRAVNRELILLYWDIGRGIVEKQTIEGWGKSVVESLARDLSEAFPGMRGFSASNLWRMRQLFASLTAPDFLAELARELAPKAKEPEILAQAVRELAGAIPWGQHVEMLNKLTEGRRGGGVCPEVENQSHRGGGVSVAVATAGGIQRQAAHGETTHRRGAGGLAEIAGFKSNR